MRMDKLAVAYAGLRVGIAGSLSGIRISHAPFFRAAHRTLGRAGVDALLGDDASSPATASALAEQFVAAGVKVVIGHFNSACAKAAVPVYRDHGVTVLLPASTDIGLELGNSIYRLCGDDAGQARAIAARIVQLRRRGGWRAITVRIDESDYAQRLLVCLRQALDGAVDEVIGIDERAVRRDRLEVVLATAARAVAHASTRDPDAEVTIYSDEAAVQEFAAVARTGRHECYVVTPRTSYATLLARGCAWIASGAGGAPPSEAGWTLKRCGGMPVPALAQRVPK